MKKSLLLLCATMSSIVVNAQITPSMTIPNPIPEYNGTYEDFGQNHLFYPNAGEIRYDNKERSTAAAEVLFYTKHTYPQEYLLANNGISFVFTRHDSSATISDSLHRIDLLMERGDSSAFLARIDSQNTCKLNYFTEWFASSGRTNVQGGAAIACQSIWKSIDMVYTSNNAGLKIYYIVYPGGDPTNIMLRVTGSKDNYITNSELVLEANWDKIRFAQPQAYQYTYVNNVVTPVNLLNATWSSIGTDLYQIATVPAYNDSLPLIIELSQGMASTSSIANLEWSTYFGGGETDFIFRTKSDANNNLFVAGETVSNDFPQNPNANPLQYTNNYTDAFVSKFNSNGVLQWSTYFGGSSSEYIKDFDFKSGDVWCVGYTESTNLPLQSKTGAFNDASFNGNSDGFILQLSTSTGGTNSWSTYFGGNGFEFFRGCKFDGNGQFFVVGSSNSTNMSLTGPTGSYQQNYNSAQQSGSIPITDCIIMCFNASTSGLDWFTFFGTDVLGTNAGTNKSDEFWDVDVSGSDVYACGFANGTNLPSAINTKMLSGTGDGILARFSAAGVLNSSKFTSNVINKSVRVFDSRVYTCGSSKNGATNVNSGNYYYDNTCASGDFDACFSVHSTNLSTTYHNTFFGGTGSDEGFEMQFGSNGVFYISGCTYASNYPITTLSGVYSQNYAGNAEYFVSAFQYGHSNMIWSTCLGSSSDETDQNGECASISLQGQGLLHLGGCSNSYNSFPLDNNGGVPYYQSTRAGSQSSFFNTDGTITRFDLTALNTYVGLAEFKGTSFSFGVYPNPASNKLIIDNDQLKNQRLTFGIYDMVGNKLDFGSLDPKDNHTVDVSHLQPGVYIINVSNGTTTLSNKFIKVNQ